MKLSVLLSIAAIYMALVGLGWIFAPQAKIRNAEPSSAWDAVILGNIHLGRATKQVNQGT